MEKRKARRTEPRLDGETPPATEHFGLDPQDVRRYEQRLRRERTLTPMGKAARVAAVVLVGVGAFLVTWNLGVLRQVRLDFSEVTSLFARDGGAPAGARPSEEPGTEVVEDTSIAGAVSLPTSIKTGEEPAAETTAAENTAPSDASAPAPASSNAAAAAPAPSATPPAEEPAPTDAAAPPAPDAAAAANEPPARPAPPPEPELPPTPETIGFGLESMTVSEADASAAVLVLRDGGRRGVSFFSWWTSNGSATAGSDFAALDRRVERFAAGEQNRTLHVPIVGDRSVEGPENFYVHIAAGEESNAREVARIEVVINDDD